MSLKAEIIADIRANGPMRLSDYMRRCNAHYYATRVPFGTGGDFITAPEISQIFGELIGVWAADMWLRAGSPSPFNLVELGPGRGTLMQDALRATAKVPGFHAAMLIHFVETSPILRDEQKKRVPQAMWHADVAAINSDAPLIVIANEFFDALPIDQRCFGQHRKVCLKDDALAWTNDADHGTRQDSVAIESEIATLCYQLQQAGGAALIIDYGQYGIRGDTLQSLKSHAYADPLDKPGEQDITALVDFLMIDQVAISSGGQSFGPVCQGEFLCALGLELRTAQLAQANPARCEDIIAASARLANPDQMGELFKVMCITSTNWPKPAGFL